MLAKIYYYMKAVVGGLYGGVLALEAMLGTDFGWSAFAHLTVGQWFLFLQATLGIGAAVGIVANGPKPVKRTTVAKHTTAAPTTAPAAGTDSADEDPSKYRVIPPTEPPAAA